MASRWTPAEIHILRTHWNDLAERDLLSRLPGRPRAGVLWKAIALGLPFGAPPSMWSLPDATRHLGIDIGTLHRILAWAEVPILRRRSAWRFVDRDLAENAYRRWLRAETCWDASRRHRINYLDLRRAAVAVGVYPAERRYNWRVESAVWDRIVASMRMRPR